MKSVKLLCVIAAGMLFLSAFTLYATGFLGNSSARVAREHSVTLPPSASNIRCEGLFAITALGDFEADTSFDVTAADLPGILSQFTWQLAASTKSISEFMPVPMRFSRPGAMRRGVSRDGNEVILQPYDLGAGRDGVCICTQWN